MIIMLIMIENYDGDDDDFHDRDYGDVVHVGHCSIILRMVMVMMPTISIYSWYPYTILLMNSMNSSTAIMTIELTS